MNQKETCVFKRYNVYFEGKLMGFVRALSKNSALDKGAILVEESTGIRRSASKYSGLPTQKIEVRPQ